MLIELDEGYSFGLGLFETILLYNGKPVFLDEHLARINKSIENLALNIDKLEKDEIFQYLNNNKNALEYEVLKIVLSEKNRLFLKREYTYTEKDYHSTTSSFTSRADSASPGTSRGAEPNWPCPSPRWGTAASSFLV